MSKKLAAACLGALLLTACDGPADRVTKSDAAVSVPHAHQNAEPKPATIEPAAHGGRMDAGRDASAPIAADSGKPMSLEAPDAGHHQPVMSDAGNAQEEDAGPAAPRCHAGVAVRAAGSPTVWLVIDGSGSMLDPFGMTTSRWDAMREVLVNPNDGLVKSLQGELRWGLVLFDGPGAIGTGVLPDGGMIQFPTGPATTCPRTVQVEPQLNNFAALQTAFPELPLGGSTPTDKVLELLLQRYPAAAGSADGPVSVVLASDGAPNDLCSLDQGFLTPPPDVRPYVVNAVRKLLDRGITTYTLSLANLDQQLMLHLTDVAAAGGTGKPVFTPSDKDALASALREIVGNDVDCSLRLNKCVALTRACDGAVALDGRAVPCDEHNGFSLHDEATLQLKGEACARYRASKTRKIDIDYPCESVVL
jgi:hypothetical protein